MYSKIAAASGSASASLAGNRVVEHVLPDTGAADTGDEDVRDTGR